MEANKNSPTSSSKTVSNRQSKCTTHYTQKQTIFHYLQDHVATASMTTEVTGIPQKCIIRYKRDLEKADMLWEVEKKYCERTGCLAWYLTTDPNKAPKTDMQLELWGGH